MAPSCRRAHAVTPARVLEAEKLLCYRIAVLVLDVEIQPVLIRYRCVQPKADVITIVRNRSDVRVVFHDAVVSGRREVWQQSRRGRIDSRGRQHVAGEWHVAKRIIDGHRHVIHLCLGKVAIALGLGGYRRLRAIRIAVA